MRHVTFVLTNKTDSNGHEKINKLLIYLVKIHRWMNTLVEHMLTFKFMTATQSNALSYDCGVHIASSPRFIERHVTQCSIYEQVLLSIYKNEIKGVVCRHTYGDI